MYYAGNLQGITRMYIYYVSLGHSRKISRGQSNIEDAKKI